MQDGLLVKSARVLETLPKVSHLLFDKTGTLTHGELSIQRIHPFSSERQYSESELLRLAAALEAHSSHPVAQAFKPYRDASVNAFNVINHASAGLEGIINSALSDRPAKICWY